jgi:hypothetical protein
VNLLVKIHVHPLVALLPPDLACGISSQWMDMGALPCLDCIFGLKDLCLRVGKASVAKLLLIVERSKIVVIVKIDFVKIDN